MAAPKGDTHESHRGWPLCITVLRPSTPLPTATDAWAVLLANEGMHKFFDEEREIRDVRREPIRFAGYSVSFRKGKDGKCHPSVRIEPVEYRLLKCQFLRMALNGSLELLIS
jgi:hypothetical protein